MMKFSAVNLDVKDSKFFFFIEGKSYLKTRLGLINFFTATTRPILTSVPSDINSSFIKIELNEEEFKVFSELVTVYVPKSPVKFEDLEKVEPNSNYSVYGVLPVDNSILLIKLSDNGNVPPFTPFDQFHLSSGMIANYTSDTPVVTDAGKFLVNYLLLADIFNDLIPYQNKKLTTKNTDKLVAEQIAANKASRNEYRKYMDQGYWLLENGGIFVSAFTERALTTGDEVLAKKKELLTKYKDELDNPDVLARIEAELIDMDKSYIKGDTSEIFFEACGKKAYKEARKKMFLTFGMSKTFGSGGVGFKFTPNSLEDGWEPKYLATGANEIRRGAYGRAIETAEGGAESKFILRTFQETKITEDDCHDKRGMPVTFTEDNVNLYLGRFLVDGTEITNSNVKSLIGKTYKVRSPMTCRTKDGFCFQCCGSTFRKINMVAIGMQTLAVTSSFTSASMSSMHRSFIATTELSDIKEVIIKNSI